MNGSQKHTLVLLIFPTVMLLSCRHHSNMQMTIPVKPTQDQSATVETSPRRHLVPVRHDVRIRDYFDFMDSLVKASDSTHRLDEYVLVHANPWIIDSLRSMDYYVLKAKGVFLYDQSRKIILRGQDSLAIPDSLTIISIKARLKATVLDINIPEFKLRIIQSADTLLTCRVRVGRNDSKYLAIAKHIVDLRTPIGDGEIVRIERDPVVVDPETGIRYDSTRRDDGQYTKLPVIPWLEPTINGRRYGSLIHPTTNPATLGRAISHGCVGVSEADAWTIYYNAPIGTKVRFRYDLKSVSEKGDTVRLKDIYKRYSKAPLN